MLLTAAAGLPASSVVGLATGAAAASRSNGLQSGATVTRPIGGSVGAPTPTGLAGATADLFGAHNGDGNVDPGGFGQESRATDAMDRAPAALRAAVGTTLGVPAAAAASAFQKAKLTAGDAAAGDDFGVSVALFGSTAVVGAPNKSSAAGVAYVFVRSSSGTWLQQAELSDPGGASRDEFGSAVALYKSTTVIGALGTNGLTGAAYVFTRSSAGTWSQQAELTASDGTPGDDLGSSVALAGSTAEVGAPFENSDTGAAYVFALAYQQAELTASDGTTGEDFGYSVALAGSTAVVGTPEANGGTGAAYVFVRSGQTWSQQADLTVPGGTVSDFFGYSVAFAGSTAVVGAPGRNSNTGTVYLYTRSNGTWSQRAELTTADGRVYNYFGDSVAVSGSTGLVAAYGQNSSTGTTYVFVNL